MVQKLLISIFFIIGVSQLNGQSVIFTDPGKMYNDTDGRTEDIYGPVDISNCSSISVSLDFEFSLPWEGSGNMESSDECSFGDPCMPDPDNPLNGDCGGCWDFLYVRYLIDGTEVFTELIGGPGTTDTDQTGTITLNGYCISTENELTIEVYTQTWAGDESITFSGIEVLCWENIPDPTATPNPVCKGEDIQLDETSGNYSSWSWTGPAGFNSSQQNPLIPAVDISDAGFYTVTVQDPNNCDISDSVEVQVIDFPTLPSLGPYCEVDAPVSLPNPVNGISGTWSGPGVSGNTFDPGIAGAGTVNLTFTESTGQCNGDITVTVNPETIIDLPTFGPFCEDDSPFNLPTTLNSIDGNWSGPGVSSNIFTVADAGTGTHTLTFTPLNNECASPITYNVEVNPVPTANPAGPITACDDGSPIDLTQLNSTITGGNGSLNVNWYEDMGLTTLINNPSSYIPGPTTVYATVSNGNCSSSSVSIIINLTTVPAIFPISPIDTCGDENGNITIDLTEYDNQINGGNGIPVEWYTDAGLNNQITSPSAYNTSGDILYAIVVNGECASSSIMVDINVEAAPTGNTTTITVCGSGNNIEYDLTSVEDDIYQNGMNFSWYEDIDTTVLIIDPATFITTPPTTVYAVFTDGCKSIPVAVSLEVENAVDLGTLVDVEVCNGDVLILDGPSINGVQYEWNGPNGFQSSMEDPVVTTDAQSTDSGTYTLIGTLGNCSDTAELIVEVYDETVASINILEEINCNGGSNAEIEAIYSGGSNPVQFDWSDDTYDGLQTLSNIPAGNYEVTITDMNGCTASANINVSEPPVLTFNCGLLSGVSGPGASDAEVEVIINGGVEPYELSWTGADMGMMNIPVAGNYTVSDLPEGTINFTITDENGCVVNCSVIIPEADCELSAEIIQTDSIQCAGDSTAAIDLNITNGTLPITYAWNESDYDGLDSITNVGAGTYSVTITDDNDCQLIENITIQEPFPLVIECGQVQAESSMDADDGIGFIIFSDGTQGYEIEWSGPETGDTTSSQADSIGIERLLSGEYQVTITDKNGCTETCIFEIDQENISCTLNLSIEQTDSIICHGDSTAGIVVTVLNGMLPYDYDWSDPDISNVRSPIMLAAGTYSVTVEDDAGCTGDTSIIITQPSPITINCEITEQPTTPSSMDGEVEIGFTGDPSIYDIVVSGPLSDTFKNISSPYLIDSLDAGGYNFTVIDSNGCSNTCNLVLSASDCNLSLDLSQGDTIQCYGDITASINSSVNNAGGVVRFDWNDDALDGEPNPSNLGVGTYILTITDDNNCIAIDTVVINQPTPLMLNCNALDDSSVEITIDGGTAGYSFQLNGPISQSGSYNTPGTYTLSNLDTGDYTLILTDGNGCKDTCYFTLSGQACNLTLDSTINQISCSGSADGEIILNISGGNGTSTIEWNDPTYDGMDTLSNLSSGIYSVTVTESSSCKDSMEIIIMDPPEAVVNIEGGNTLCGNTDLVLSVVDTFAHYIWNGEVGNATYVVDMEGQVTIEVENVNGCIASDTIRIARADTALTMIVDTLCAEESIVVNGTVYDSSNPDGVEVIEGGSSGGCDSTIIVDLEFRGAFEVEVVNPNCVGVYETKIEILDTIGSALPFDIYFDGTFYETVNSLPFTITTPGEGSYLLEIVDALGCNYSENVTILSREEVIVEVTAPSSVIEGDTIMLSADINGTYKSIQWLPSDIVSCDTCLTTTAIIDNNTIFTVEVVDSFGCRIIERHVVIVSEGKSVYIPNIFTPNLDGINEVFRAYLGDQIVGLKELEVFDRWGNRIYQESYTSSTKNIIGWNGKYKGNRLNSDVFVYKIIIEVNPDQFKTFTGTVTLIQ